MMGDLETDNIKSKGSDGITIYDDDNGQAAKIYADGSLKFKIENVDIGSGTIDGTTIATSDITVGSGKTLDVSDGTLTLAYDQISGNVIEGGTINDIIINTLTSTSATITTISPTTINAFTLAGKLTAGVNEIEGSNFDINGGTIDDVAIGTAVISDSTINAFTLAGKLTAGVNEIEGSNFDINGGTIDDVVINNSTIGITTALAGSFTDLTATGITDTGLTANRAIYTNGSKVLTSSAITNTELGYLEGASSNIQDQLNGKLGSISLLSDRVAISDSLGGLASSVITSNELSTLDNITSNIQTQIDSKQETIIGAATTIDTENLTPNRVLLSNGSGKVAASSIISITELESLNGISSSSTIQVQLDGKITSVGVPAIGDIIYCASAGTWIKTNLATLVEGMSMSMDVYVQRGTITGNWTSNQLYLATTVDATKSFLNLHGNLLLNNNQGWSEYVNIHGILAPEGHCFTANELVDCQGYYEVITYN